jgi:hypothetical protein
MLSSCLGGAVARSAALSPAPRGLVERPEWAWVDRFGGRGRDAPRAVAIAAGGIYSTGQLAHVRAPGEQSWSGDAAHELMFLARHADDGRREWLLRFGGSPVDEPRALAVAGDGTVLVAGLFTGELGFGAAGLQPLRSVGGADAFLLAIGDDGAPRWALAWGGKHADVARALTLDAAGNLYVAGTFQLTADFDPGPGRRLMASAGRTDAFVLKLDPERRLLWARRFGGEGADDATALAVAADGGVYIGGSFEGRAWGEEGDGGEVAAAGAAIYVAALAPDGSRRWLRRFEAARGATLAGLATGAEDAVDAGGSFQGSLRFEERQVLDNPAGWDLFSARLDPAGTLRWVRDVGADTDSSVTVEAVAATGSGPLLGGSFQGTVDFDPGTGRSNLVAATTAGFVLALDAGGSFSWAGSPAASGYSQVLAMAAGDAGKAAVVGVSQPETTFRAARATESSPESGKSDVFVSLARPPSKPLRKMASTLGLDST